MMYVGGIMNTLKGYLEYCGDTQYREGYYDAVQSIEMYLLWPALLKQ